MTDDEFNNAVKRTRLKKRGIDAARHVLVFGLGKAEAGRKLNPVMQRAEVAEKVARIERAYREMMGAPSGFCCVTVCLPVGSDSINQVKEIEQREKFNVVDM